MAEGATELTADGGVTVRVLLGSLGVDLPEGFPEGLADGFALTSARVRLRPRDGEFVLAATASNATGTLGGSLVFATSSSPGVDGGGTAVPDAGRVWLVRLAAQVPARLSDLPMLHGQIPADQDVGLDWVGAQYASGPVPAALLRDAGALLGLDPPITPLPATITAAGLSLSVLVTVPGTGQVPLTVPLGGKGTVGRGAAGGGEDGPDAAGSAPPAAGGSGVVEPSGVRAVGGADAAPGASLDIDRQVGPLHLRRVTLSAQEGTVVVGLDAALAVSGITLEASGLGFAVTLASPVEVTPQLRGLGVDFDRPPVRVAGAILRQSPAKGFTDQFGGVVIVTLPSLDGTLVAQYAQGPAGASFCAFGQIVAGAGRGIGPPPFRVVGAMLGGGYNSAVRIPAMGEVSRFPLVAGVDQATDPPPAPLEVLQDLTGGTEPWLQPKIGTYWAAVGIRFTSFEFLAGRALALVEFGDDLTVGLFALLSAGFPTKKRDSDRVWAQIEIEMRALYQRSLGLFSFTAQLTPNSYLIDPDFALTGGFAVNVWTAPYAGRPSHAGDFVLTVGGYRDGFTVPDHYPRVPRLGARWAFGNAVTLTASAYLAITPDALMVGMESKLVYDQGPVRAWCEVGFDGYLRWTKPCRYALEVRVGIGVRFTVTVWFVRVTFQVEIHVECAIWGEPFGGTATIDLGLISFTVGFGADRPADLPSAWNDVREQLPPPLQVRPDSGLLAGSDPAHDKNGRPEGSEEVWQVARDGFSFTTASLVPATAVYLGSSYQGQKPLATDDKPLGLRPMGLAGVTSQHRVLLHRLNDQGIWEEIRLDAEGPLSHWKVDTVEGTVPAALWGEVPPDGPGQGPQPWPGPPGQGEVPPGGEPLLPDRLVGVTATAPTTQEGTGPGDMTQDNLAHEELPGLTGMLPARPGGPAARTDPGSIAKITATIAEPGTSQRRRELLEALTGLAVQPPQPCDQVPARYADVAPDLLTDPPLILDATASAEPR
ncbi:DUF6603 domain-containing protein [Streptomyces buecherae]|uniref:DUF6603 domain-containing protein n=1 Tax=Streptomyces buecherae TaxID=2763006 RepID=A0A7H8NGH3_9ACTN|nr:DUF6603 domain-containing protein [Streptomyces buecherae]QKW53603.1 hypothetical protein HUT08_33195 [Streptomyces buecherae]